MRSYAARMPLVQGHWARQQAPFVPRTRRERRALAFAAVLAAVIVALLCWSVLAGSAPKAETGCHYKTVPSTMGAGSYKVCDQSTER
jgi:hypothetical protein